VIRMVLQNKSISSGFNSMDRCSYLEAYRKLSLKKYSERIALKAVG
jgi:hypothetical protein